MIKQKLIEARQLIENKEDWFGCDNPPTCRDQLCAALAIVKVCPAMSDEVMTIQALASAITGQPQTSPYRSFVKIAQYNNTHTHAEVLEKFDAAIAASGELVDEVAV